MGLFIAKLINATSQPVYVLWASVSCSDRYLVSVMFDEPPN